MGESLKYGSDVNRATVDEHSDEPRDTQNAGVIRAEANTTVTQVSLPPSYPADPEPTP